ncbi:MAG: hypothetical protein JNM22_11285 [Saprospiraceae bacterium]|nr:hypothetical protein [Saprospiraceae bacterium]
MQAVQKNDLVGRRAWMVHGKIRAAGLFHLKAALHTNTHSCHIGLYISVRERCNDWSQQVLHFIFAKPYRSDRVSAGF